MNGNHALMHVCFAQRNVEKCRHNALVIEILMKKQGKTGYEAVKTPAKAGTVKPSKEEKLETEEPIAEKDEVKQAEEEQRKRIKKEQP